MRQIAHIASDWWLTVVVGCIYGLWIVALVGCTSGVNQLNKSAQKIDDSAEIQAYLADKATSAFEEGADPRPFPSGNQRRSGQDSGGSVERAGGDDESGGQNAVVGGTAGQYKLGASDTGVDRGTDLPDTLHPDRRGDQQGDGLGAGVDTDPIHPQGDDGREGGSQWRGDSGGQGSNSSESRGVPDLRSGVRESAEGGEKAAESDSVMDYDFLLDWYTFVGSQLFLVAVGVSFARTIGVLLGRIENGVRGKSKAE